MTKILVALLALSAFQTPAPATAAPKVITQTVVNCYPETYWCTDPVTGLRRLCVRRVCDR